MGGKKRQSLTRLTYKDKTMHVFDVSLEATTLSCGFNGVAGWDHVMLHIAVCQKAKMASAFDPDWKSPLCHSSHMTLCLMPIKAWYGKSRRSVTAGTLSEIWTGKSPTQIQLANLHIPSPGPKICSPLPHLHLWISKSYETFNHHLKCCFFHQILFQATKNPSLRPPTSQTCEQASWHLLSSHPALWFFICIFLFPARVLAPLVMNLIFFCVSTAYVISLNLYKFSVVDSISSSCWWRD